MFYEKDEYEKAIPYFTRLIESDSTNGQYYFRRGYCFSGLLNKKKAIEDYKRALQYHFKEESSCLNIGLNYLFENDSLALIYLQKCLAINPNNADAATVITFCKKRLKEHRMQFDTSKWSRHDPIKLYQ